ncbi:SIMPL domain-containing protein [Uliginosibacterium sp. H3]|uniref:SIMPL domain-containing protein n=1 Tax=Uliginosibacterium silvisoli TaxID=3114758 RepID=A0ABU6K9D8_9RHOO|nr:SIMPL domain-containing protein [Uliginosibacterium sp. H3]MEC5387658.1 SIMPL domain-containing protein [Uliginosibacterium sp. H3]
MSADASRSLPNDLAQAQAYVEQTDATPAELAKRVNQRMNEALALVKTYPAIKVKTTNSQTWPVYAPKTPGRIDAWRMRSSISLKSRDIAALSELLGKLQNLTAVDQVSVGFAPETRAKASDEAMVDALKAFQARAALAAQALGKRWRIKNINVSQGMAPQPYLRAAKASMSMAEAAPAPIEAGEGLITVTINGSVELID